MRAELPGVEPTEDIEVTVLDGRLTIKATADKTERVGRDLGVLLRIVHPNVPLPAGADEDDINATYDRGILTVSVPLSDAEHAEKHVEVFEMSPRRGRR